MDDNNQFSEEFQQEMEAETAYNENIDDQKQEDQKYICQLEKQDQKLSQLEQTKQLYQKIVTLTQEGIEANIQQKRTSIKHKDLLDDYQEFSQIKLRMTVRYTVIILVFPAIYLLNLVLIYRPTEYLAKVAFAPGSWPSKMVILFLPLALQIFEIAIGSHLKISRHKEGIKNVKKFHNHEKN
ncbi:hypothetical protein VB713_28305 [Anabaena cylindrica UHCC 0172]|uniref:hypothetical protein n=1 Tax=Anabaena cylindrica TaxID=1165 RepID=UPI002B1FD38C|nr:hypothetical protein [Anabaena cylindrica]MEA5554830.1 hypothetical protein [Anabaena cylindrica UHCC 0172]